MTHDEYESDVNIVETGAAPEPTATDAALSGIPENSGATGYQSGAAAGGVSDATHAATAGQLRSFIERIERLEEEKKTLMDDIKEIYGEARSTGWDVKVIRKLIAIRKKDPADVAEEEAIMDTYKSALGM